MKPTGKEIAVFIEEASLAILPGISAEEATQVRRIAQITVTMADRIAELEHAAETTRAEHAAALEENKRLRAWQDAARSLSAGLEAGDREWLESTSDTAAALGLATARIRELEGERDELLGLLKRPFIDGCHLARWEEDPEGTGLTCAAERTCREHRRRAIVARIEKATKGAR